MSDEALVEQLAEAMREAGDQFVTTSLIRHAVLPVVAAQVEAAVSVVRAERDEARSAATAWALDAADHSDRAESAEADLRALREGLEALHVRRGDDLPVKGWCSADDQWWPCPTIALLAPSPAEGDGWPLDASVGPLGGVPMDTRPSPAEGTGEVALCPTCQHQRWKHDANGCAHREPGESICGCVAPTPVSSGEAGGCGPFCAHQTRGDKDCEDARPAPVVTPSAEPALETHGSYYGPPSRHPGSREDCKVCPPTTERNEP